MNWEALRKEDKLPPCPTPYNPFPGVRVHSPSPASVHRAALRTTLVRRDIYPGSARWNDFFPHRKREWADVTFNDLKEIVRRTYYYPEITHQQLSQALRLGRHTRNPTREVSHGLVHHADILAAYGTLISGTGGITSLPTSSTWLAGYEWFLVDNTAAAPAGLQIDWFHAGDIQNNTAGAVTANTEIRIGLVGSPDGTYWPDVFDGTPSAETVTSAGVGSSFLKYPPGSIMLVDATTGSRVYPYAMSTRDAFRGVMPKKHVTFVSQNTGQNLGATGANHKYFAQPEYGTVS